MTQPADVVVEAPTFWKIVCLEDVQWHLPWLSFLMFENSKGEILGNEESEIKGTELAPYERLLLLPITLPIYLNVNPMKNIYQGLIGHSVRLCGDDQLFHQLLIMK